MRNIIATMLCFFIATVLYAQSERNCSTMENLAYRQKNNPELKQRMQDIENATQYRIQQMRSLKMSDGVITIPVVVHVIYSDAKENISLEQIKSQIEVLNEDYRRLNNDKTTRWSQASDTQIEFCLAKVDPFGNPTNGVTRTSSTRTSWGTNDAMKKASNGGVNPWDTKSYLNMWVCNIGNGYLGYAQFPGGNASTDGVVMSPQFFGSSAKGSNFYLRAPYDLGRTATHEVGHYLNLRHIWGDGACSVDDFVTDTPASDAANYGCATSHTSCGTKDMVENFMDYSDDSCMNLFTQGQKYRMWATLTEGGFRSSLVSSNKCDALAPPTCTDGIQNGDETGVDCGGTSCEPCKVVCNDNKLKIEITFDKFPEEVSWELRKENGDILTIGAYSTGNIEGSTTIKELCVPNGCYTFRIKDVHGDGICCKQGNGGYRVTHGDKVIASGGDYGKEDVMDFCLGVDGSTCGDGIQNGDEIGIDCGGTCKPCDTDTIINQGSFENGWDDWSDGGSDCYRYFGKRSFDGDYSIRLRDDSGIGSAMTSKAYSIKTYKSIEVTFYFYAYNMAVDDQLLFHFYNGKQWQSVASWTKGIDFDKNNAFYKVTLALDALNYTFTDTSKFRFESNATSNNHQVYIDNVNIKGGATPLKGINNSLDLVRILEDSSNTNSVIDFTVYPNPIEDDALGIKMVDDVKGTYRIVNIYGQVISKGLISEEIDVRYLERGMYFVEFNIEKNQEEETTVVIKKFLKRD